MKKSIFFALMMLCAMIYQVNAQEIALWDGWAKTAVTFTFDDGGQETQSHQWAAEKLDSYDFKATFYMVTGWTVGNTWNTYKSFADNGHEIGSHTSSHSSSVISELASSKQIIEQYIGLPCMTIAYPNCQHMGNTVLDYYIAGRLCYGDINLASPTDMSKIDAIMCGTQGINTTYDIVYKCSSSKDKWVVFLIHGVQDKTGSGSYSPTNQDAFTGTLNWLNQNKKDYWVGTMRDVAMYIQERDHASFSLKEQNASAITYSLTAEIESTVCNWDHPLSLRVPAPAWTDVAVTQGTQLLESETKDGFIYFRAVPNKGDIVLQDHFPTALESIQPSAVRIQKHFRDGQLLIIRDGKTYTITGAEVR